MKSTKRIISIILSLVMILSMTVLSTASAYADAKTELLKKEPRINALKVDGNEKVTAIITLSGDAQIDKDLAGASASSAQGARKRAMTKQQALVKEMSKSFDLEVRYNYSVLFNGLAITTKFENLEKIEAMENVTGVYLANKYSVPSYDVTPMTEFSGEMMGVNTLRSSGYDGDGVIIAVLDTGLNVEHDAFQAYGNVKNPALSKDKVSATNTAGRGKYISEKVPFTYDYADKDANVADGDGHGTHVAGIAAGYAEAEDKAVVFSGQAPAAQVLGMKIFSDKGGGTDSSIYFAALEDAYLLGVDVVNMSIGAPGGFTYDAELETEVYGNLYEKLDQSGVLMCVAAGNEYSMALDNKSGFEDAVPADYTDYGTVGSPSTYLNNISVASIENTNYPSYVMTVEGDSFNYADSSETGSLWRETFGGMDLTYVLIGGFGNATDFAAASAYYTGEEDWIAVVSRGEIDFQTKLNNAAAAGAAGMICYNNVPVEEISMAIEDFAIPAVSVTKESGEILAAGAVTNKGTLNVSEDYVVIGNPEGYYMSDFSCWGTTSDLAFKPQITAPGGDIYSADTFNNSGYIVYSGTSMATPNLAGLFACVVDYLKTKDSSLTKVERAELAKKLAYSTATVVEDEEGNTYSPRKQGAGLVNADGMLDAAAYIENPLIELKDSKNGKFNFTFEVKGLEEGITSSYDVSLQVMTDNTFFDSETNKYYNDLTSFELLSADFVKVSNTKTVTVTGTEAKTVTVSVELTPDGKELLDECFENGCFIEGFVELTSNDTEASDLHATFMGYYGDWLAGDILEDLDYKTVVDYNYHAFVTELSEGQTYMEYGYTGEDFIYGECVTGYTGVYLSTLQNQDVGFLADNLFTYLPYDAKRETFATGAADSAYAQAITVYPQQLRNAAHMIMVVSDKLTGKVYYVDDTPYTRKAAYDFENATYWPSAYFMWDGKDSYDETSTTYDQYVENGREIDFSFFSWLDYDKLAQESFKELDGDYAQLISGDWDKYKVYQFDATIDNVGPKVDTLRYSSTSKKLTGTLSDNNMLQFVGVLDSLSAQQYVDFDIPTTSVNSFTTELDLTGLGDKNKFYLEACDYATNWPIQEVYISGSKLGIKDYAVNVYNEDGSKNKDHKVTLVDANGKVYKYGDMLEVGTYNVYLDGEDSTYDLVIEYFGKNTVDIGQTKQTVTLNVTHGKTTPYSPEATLELSNGDTIAEFEPVIVEKVVTTEDDVELTTDTEEVGLYEAQVMPGEYELYADGVETGVKVTVVADSKNTAKLVYQKLSYHSNTSSYLGEGPAEKFYFVGQEVTTSANVYDNGDVEFLGWSIAKDGSKEVYKAGDKFKMPENDVVLFAIWDRPSDISMLGDVNCNGKINMEDVVALQRIIAKLVKYTDYGINCEANSNVNKDKDVNMEDVVTIQKYIAQLITKF